MFYPAWWAIFYSIYSRLIFFSEEKKATRPYQYNGYYMKKKEKRICIVQALTKSIFWIYIWKMWYCLFFPNVFPRSASQPKWSCITVDVYLFVCCLFIVAGLASSSKRWNSFEFISLENYSCINLVMQHHSVWLHRAFFSCVCARSLAPSLLSRKNAQIIWIIKLTDCVFGINWSE